MTIGRLPDAPDANWVDRHAPSALRPWLQLGRFDRPAGTWLLLLPGLQGVALAWTRAASPARLAWLVIAFAAGAALMRAAGCAYNDVVDRDFDRRVARTAGRPVASGRIRPRAAVAFAVACSAVSFLILLTLGPAAVALGVASLGLVAAYPFMKRITWWPQAWLGLTFNWGALMGFAALDGRIALPAGLLYAGGVAWTLGYDTIYALQDVEDDALAGVKSSARRLGPHAPGAIAAAYALAALLALAAGVATHVGAVFYALWGLYAAHLAWQAARVRVDDPGLALRLFRSNRDAGLALLIAILIGRLAAG